MKPDDTSPPTGKDMAQIKRELQQLAELARSGALPDEPYQAARAKLERALIEAVMTGGEEAMAAPARTRPPRLPSKLTWGMLAFTCAVVAGGYALVGTPSAWRIGPDSTTEATSPSADKAPPLTGKASAPHALGEEQVNAMVESLADKLKKAPRNPEGWAMLARSYAALRRFDAALPAYREAIAQRPDDAQLYADLADALAITQNRTLDGEPGRLLDKALALEPTNFKALYLSGTRAFDRQDFKGAVAQWEKALPHAPADNPDMQRQVREALDDARLRAGLPAAAAPAGSASSVAGTVSLAPSLRDKVSPGDTVFIFARAAQGPRMPLAIVRKQVKDLPYRFELSDAQAMSTQLRLTGFAELVVGARVSKSGDALPQPGDWSGQTGMIKLGSQDLQVTIDTAAADKK